MTRRDWYAGGVGSSITGAAIGAIIGSGFILGFNLACLALNLVLWHMTVQGGNNETR